MISKEQFEKEIEIILENALREDLGDGDHSSLACIPSDAKGGAKLIVKGEGIIAGLEFAKMVFNRVDPGLDLEMLLKDGDRIRPRDVAFLVRGSSRSILKSERLVLNAMQRMSAIATKTYTFVEKIEDTKTKILDTRKTTPGLRALEKWAVKIGGGENHRFGLFDMIMLKDNHIDFAGGIATAIKKTIEYLEQNQLNLKIIVEARDISEIQQIIEAGGADRILIDNFSVEDTKRAVALIDGRFQTESSGGITLETVRSYAECGVDYISCGALTHSVKNLDLSLKAL